MMRDMANRVDVRSLIYPTRVSDNTAQVSQIIDLQDAQAVTLIVLTGTLADADATFQALVEDGNDSALADNAEVNSAFLIGIEGVAATPTGLSFRYDSDNKHFKIGYIGPKRYLRLTITPASNSGNSDIAACAVLEGTRKQPRSSQVSN